MYTTDIRICTCYMDIYIIKALVSKLIRYKVMRRLWVTRSKKGRGKGSRDGVVEIRIHACGRDKVWVNGQRSDWIESKTVFNIFRTKVPTTRVRRHNMPGVAEQLRK